MIKIDDNLLELVKSGYDEYSKKKSIFNRIYEHYKGNSDAMSKYKVTERSNIKVPCNFFKKFIKEEVSYTLGNDITLKSISDNKIMLEELIKALKNKKSNYDVELAKEMVMNGLVFEINYIDKNKNVAWKKVSPRNGYAYINENEELEFFIHVIQKKFDDKTFYIDVYTSNCIYHLFEDLTERLPVTTHPFKIVPVGIGEISEEVEYDTLFNDIIGINTDYGLQGAYETNLSDISNEISNLRLAYLKMIGATLDDETKKNMKENEILNIPSGDPTKIQLEYLVKNINDTFIQNTLNVLKDNMFQLANHINVNEKLQSNLSGVALRSRLIGLEQRCSLNQKGFLDILNVRYQCIFENMRTLGIGDYDWRDVVTEFTPNIPTDLTALADIVSKIPPKVMSNETKMSLFPNVTNIEKEKARIKKETEEELNNFSDLNTGVDVVE